MHMCLYGGQVAKKKGENQGFRELVDIRERERGGYKEQYSTTMSESMMLLWSGCVRDAPKEVLTEGGQGCMCWGT
jgi:hypothetical protein